MTLSINFETGARERKTRREEMTPMAALYGNERLGEGKRVSCRGLGRGRGESGREPGCQPGLSNRYLVLRGPGCQRVLWYANRHLR